MLNLAQFSNFLCNIVLNLTSFLLRVITKVFSTLYMHENINLLCSIDTLIYHFKMNTKQNFFTYYHLLLSLIIITYYYHLLFLLIITYYHLNEQNFSAGQKNSWLAEIGPCR